VDLSIIYLAETTKDNAYSVSGLDTQLELPLSWRITKKDTVRIKPIVKFVYDSTNDEKPTNSMVRDLETSYMRKIWSEKDNRPSLSASIRVSTTVDAETRLNSRSNGSTQFRLDLNKNLTSRFSLGSTLRAYQYLRQTGEDGSLDRSYHASLDAGYSFNDRWNTGLSLSGASQKTTDAMWSSSSVGELSVSYLAGASTTVYAYTGVPLFATHDKSVLVKDWNDQSYFGLILEVAAF
jgi:hypothetical protein